MPVIAQSEPENSKGPACDCGSPAVIDANRHTWWCKRRLWVERNEAREQLRGAVAARDALAKLVKAEYPDDLTLHEIAATWGEGLTADELEALREWGQ